MIKKAALTLIALAAAALPLTSINAGGPIEPELSASLSPSPIGPYSQTKLTFTIDNEYPGAEPIDNVAFSITLPTGVYLATPAKPTTDCEGDNLVLTAPDGGQTLSFSGGEVGPGQVCTVCVNVTGEPIEGSGASYMLDSSSLTWGEEDSSGPALTILDVDVDRPGFTKAFYPAGGMGQEFTGPTSVNIGDRVTLMFSIDNFLNGNTATNLQFVDNLPAGLEVANPPNIVNDCGGTVVATPGANTISLSGGSVGQSSSCSVSVDVVVTGAGRLENCTGELLSSTPDAETSGFAGAVLDVTIPEEDLLFTKQFIDDPASPGDTVTLEFTIQNLSRTDTATGITFTDDLTTVLTGLTATLPPSPDPPCGAGSTLTGSAGDTVLTLAGGSLGPGESCTFEVTLNIPAGATVGSYLNTTSDLTATVAGDGVTIDPAIDTLFISNAPILTKSFLVNPVVTGGSSRIQFTITNPNPVAATDVAFIDNLSDFLGPRVLTATVPADGFCGPNSKVDFIQGSDPQGDGGSSGTPSIIDISGIHLAPTGQSGATCTFEVIVDIPLGIGFGDFICPTGPLMAIVDGIPVTGKNASDDLTIVSGVNLTKEFTDDPVAPGGTATLEFTLSLDESAPTSATNIAFTDNLATLIPGLASTSPTQTDICGPGSSLSGTTTLSFTGGTLAPGESCTFSVQVAVPQGADAGSFTNDTSIVTATIAGLATQGLPASDVLLVNGLLFTKEFIDDPVIPGGTVTLRFTLDNTNGAVDATEIAFDDDLEILSDANNPLNALSLAPSGPLPSVDPSCGVGATLAFVSDSLQFRNGIVPAGQSCFFEVILDVPGDAANDTYPNVTDPQVATIDGTQIGLPPATDELTVAGGLLTLTKKFKDDPVAPGGTVKLEFTLTNLDPNNGATGIGFTDDLSAVIPGGMLASTSGTKADVCGLGSSITGTTMLTFSGGTLGPGESCTFDVDVLVPGGADGGRYPNTTSGVTGTINTQAVTGDPASDDLDIGLTSFTKQFVPDSVLPGGIATLEFTITNNSNDPVSMIGFSDDLDTLALGATVAGPLPADPCGAGSTLTGTSIVVLSDASLLPAGSCTFSVDVQIPVNAPLGVRPNATSPLTVLGLPVAPPATADLYIDGAGDTEQTALEVPLDQNGMAWVDGILRTGDIDFYKFTVAAGSTATVYTSGGLDTLGSLFKSSGNPLNDPIADGDLGAGDNFQSTEILGPGTYFVQVIGVTPLDTGPYMFHIELTALDLRPDGLIGRKPTSLKGNNIYNKSAAGQKITVRGKAKRGRTHKWNFAVENDGADPDVIRIRPAKPNVNDRRWRVRIFQLTGGRKNVTGAFEKMLMVEPFDPGERIVYQVKASLKFNPVKPLQRIFGVRARSNLDPAKCDEVESKVKLRP